LLHRRLWSPLLQQLQQLLLVVMVVVVGIKNDETWRNCDNDGRHRATPTRVDYSLYATE